MAHVVVSDAFAGTERYVATAAMGSAKAGLDVAVIGGDPARMKAALSVRPDVVYLPATGPAEAWRALRSIGEVDIVHAHLTAAEAAAVTAVGPRTVVVSTRHIAARRGRGAAGRAMAPWIRARLDGQVAPSRFVASKVDGACAVIPTGVEDAPMGAHDEAVVLMAQRLERDKDTATGLRAWAASGLASRGWELHVAGSGADADRLRTVASQLGVASSCHWLGQTDNVAERLGRASILLATAPADSFGLSVVEAMASGLAVVATEAGGHRETLGSVAGAAMYPVGDHRAASALLRCLASSPADRYSYGAAAQAYQRSELSISIFVERLINWYREKVMARRPPTPDPVAGRAPGR